MSTDVLIEVVVRPAQSESWARRVLPDGRVEERDGDGPWRFEVELGDERLAELRDALASSGFEALPARLGLERVHDALITTWRVAGHEVEAVGVAPDEDPTLEAVDLALQIAVGQAIAEAADAEREG